MEKYCTYHPDCKLKEGCKICKRVYCIDCSKEGLLNELSKGEIKHELIKYKEFNILYPHKPKAENEQVVVNIEIERPQIERSKLLLVESLKELKEYRLKKEAEKNKELELIKTVVRLECVNLKNEFFGYNKFSSYKLMEAKISYSKLVKYQNRLSRIKGQSISKKVWEDIKLKLESLIKKEFSKLNVQSTLGKNLAPILIGQKANAISLGKKLQQIKEKKANITDYIPIFSVLQTLRTKGNSDKVVEEWLKNCLKEVNAGSLAPYFENLRRKYLLHEKSSSNELEIFIQFLNYIKELKENESYRHLNMKYAKLFDLLSSLQKLLLIHFGNKSNGKFPYNYFLRGQLGTLLLNTINSPFLFYLEWKNTESIMHIKNLRTNEIHKINYYPRNSHTYDDCEQFKGFLFCIGGYNNSLLNTCWGIELSKLPAINKVKSLMKVARHDGGAISTINNLYIIGGCNYSDMICDCEKYDLKSNQWTEISPLNNDDYYITLFYNSPFEIFTCGGAWKKIYEKLNIDPSIKNSKWEVLQVSDTSDRGYGIAYQISKSEVLLFGGGSAPTEFVVFDFVNRKCTNQGKQFIAKYSFNTSKCRLFNNLIHIVSYHPEKYVYKIDIKNMTFEHSAIDF